MRAVGRSHTPLPTVPRFRPIAPQRYAVRVEFPVRGTIIRAAQASTQHRFVPFPDWNDDRFRQSASRFAMDLAGGSHRHVVSMVDSARDIHLATLLGYTHFVYDPMRYIDTKTTSMYHKFMRACRDPVTDLSTVYPNVVSVDSLPELFRCLQLSEN